MKWFRKIASKFKGDKDRRCTTCLRLLTPMERLYYGHTCEKCEDKQYIHYRRHL